jgi:hypothetical protein
VCDRRRPRFDVADSTPPRPVPQCPSRCRCHCRCRCRRWNQHQSHRRRCPPRRCPWERVRCGRTGSGTGSGTGAGACSFGRFVGTTAERQATGSGLRTARLHTGHTAGPRAPPARAPSERRDGTGQDRTGQDRTGQDRTENAVSGRTKTTVPHNTGLTASLKVLTARYESHGHRKSGRGHAWSTEHSAGGMTMGSAIGRQHRQRQRQSHALPEEREI